MIEAVLATARFGLAASAIPLFPLVLHASSAGSALEGSPLRRQAFPLFAKKSELPTLSGIRAVH